MPPLLPIGHFRVESGHASWACSWGLGCVNQQRGSGGCTEISGEGLDVAGKCLITFEQAADV